MKFFAAFRLYSENQTHECFQHFNRIEIISLTVWKQIMLEKLPVFCHSGCGFRDEATSCCCCHCETRFFAAMLGSDEGCFFLAAL